jgi:predicted transcriptional regulator
MKCLKVKDEFAKLIIEGVKDWEIRTRNTNIRGFIAIGSTKSKKVIGYAKLVNSFPTSVSNLKRVNHHHRANEFLDAYGQGREELFVWILESPMKEEQPYPYSFSTGSWCVADPSLNETKAITKPEHIREEKP